MEGHLSGSFGFFPKRPTNGQVCHSMNTGRVMWTFRGDGDSWALPAINKFVWTFGTQTSVHVCFCLCKPPCETPNYISYNIYPMALVLKPTVNIVKMYVYTENEVPSSSKVIAWTETQTNTQSDKAVACGSPYLVGVLKKGLCGPSILWLCVERLRIPLHLLPQTIVHTLFTCLGKSNSYFFI